MTRGATFNAAEAVEPFVRLLGKPLPGRVIDLACGPGIVSAAVAQAGSSVVGLDATAEMLEKARQRCLQLDLPAGFSVEFHQGVAEDLPFEAESFGGAVTRLSIHHFEDPALVLRELRGTLEPGAPLVLGDIIASSDAIEAQLHNGLESLRDPSHVRLLPQAELLAVVEGAGFEIRTVESWTNRKTFDEWAAIVEEARTLEPVRDVMHALAASGVDAGIQLALREGQIEFSHHWRFVQATAC